MSQPSGNILLVKVSGTLWRHVFDHHDNEKVKEYIHEHKLDECKEEFMVVQWSRYYGGNKEEGARTISEQIDVPY